ncbi:MAG: hypothetical protein HOH36_05280 [Acidimicrobiaceae bacterium]|nr:hypothetical protein [Acidimicrobiaceae bacterium]MBT5582145.1 hypothetical protein [Acidimicrobiaceae bacterium]MBT5849835.1 hypothetical protein [Acidimicrobiaceae bacterium]
MAPSDVYGTHLMVQLSDVEDVSALDDARYGHSGVVLLHESHAAIYTYAARRSLFFDVCSCKLFDVRSVVQISHETFGNVNIAESTVLDRGHHWDADVEIELGWWLESQ